jgi:hypothetical protein
MAPPSADRSSIASAPGTFVTYLSTYISGMMRESVARPMRSGRGIGTFLW